ncbi:putative reverse transcriptase domain-containing protein [Tanacetum coccineum]
MEKTGVSNLKDRMYVMTTKEDKVVHDVVTGIILVNSIPACVLYNPGASVSFVSHKFSKNLFAPPNKLPFLLEVEITDSKVVVVSNVYRDVEIEIDDSIFKIDLIPIMLGVFDIVIGMDWLDKYDANILFSQKLIWVINPQGREIIIYEDRKKGDFKLCSVMKAYKYLSHGCYAFIAHVIDTSFKKKSVEDVLVVNEFLDVFPEDFPDISPERQVEFRIDLIPGATPIAKTLYRLASSEMKELMKVQFLGHVINSEGHKVDPAKTEAVMNWQAMKNVGEIQSFLGLAAHVIDTSFKKKSVEDVLVVNEFLDVFPEDFPGIPPERQVEFQIDLIPSATPIAKTLYRLAPFEMKELMSDSRGIKIRQGRIYILFRSNVKELLLEEAHKSKYSIHLGATKMYLDLRRIIGGWRWKIYADNRRRPIEFNVGDFVMLKVSPWKGVMWFKNKGKLSPTFIGPFKILRRIGEVAYTLELSEEMRGIHNTFHVSYLRKCLEDESSVITLDEIEIDPKLTSREEPIAILGRKTRQLRNKEISLVKVQWKHRMGTSIRWEPEDKMRIRYPHLFQE